MYCKVKWESITLVWGSCCLNGTKLMKGAKIKAKTQGSTASRSTKALTWGSRKATYIAMYTLALNPNIAFRIPITVPLQFLKNFFQCRASPFSNFKQNLSICDKRPCKVYICKSLQICMLRTDRRADFWIKKGHIGSHLQDIRCIVDTTTAVPVHHGVQRQIPLAWAFPIREGIFLLWTTSHSHP